MPKKKFMQPFKIKSVITSVNHQSKRINHPLNEQNYEAYISRRLPICKLILSCSKHI